jgi:hypothetical protein
VRADLDDAMLQADVVVLCCPLHTDTRHLLDARRLALFPHGAILINMARADVVDQVALGDFLREGSSAAPARRANRQLILESSHEPAADRDGHHAGNTASPRNIVPAPRRRLARLRGVDPWTRVAGMRRRLGE